VSVDKRMHTFVQGGGGMQCREVNRYKTVAQDAHGVPGGLYTRIQQMRCGTEVFAVGHHAGVRKVWFGSM
jgi:hypothetical protein